VAKIDLASRPSRESRAAAPPSRYRSGPRGSDPAVSEQDGQYEFDGAVSVAGAPRTCCALSWPRSDGRRWPMVGVASVSPLAGEGGGVGSQVEVVAPPGLPLRQRPAGGTWGGVTERSATTLVRDYQLSEARAGVIPLRASPGPVHAHGALTRCAQRGPHRRALHRQRPFDPGAGPSRRRPRGAHSEARSLDCIRSNSCAARRRARESGPAPPGSARRGSPPNRSRCRSQARGQAAG